LYGEHDWVCPLGCFTVKASRQVAPATAHKPLVVSQTEPCAQSVSLAQVVLQAPESQV
jgi:hypothetical protein